MTACRERMEASLVSYPTLMKSPLRTCLSRESQKRPKNFVFESPKRLRLPSQARRPIERTKKKKKKRRKTSWRTATVVAYVLCSVVPAAHCGGLQLTDLCRDHFGSWEEDHQWSFKPDGVSWTGQGSKSLWNFFGGTSLHFAHAVPMCLKHVFNMGTNHFGHWPGQLLCLSSGHSDIMSWSSCPFPLFLGSGLVGELLFLSSSLVFSQVPLLPLHMYSISFTLWVSFSVFLLNSRLLLAFHVIFLD